MLNIEKYKDNILAKNGSITCCANILTNKICCNSCKECKEHAMEWLLSEYEKPILDNEEKAYLSTVIKPFRSRVIYIRKLDCYSNSYYLSIILKPMENDDLCEGMHLPAFEKGTIYEGMELNREYTLKELGL